MISSSRVARLAFLTCLCSFCSYLLKTAFTSNFFLIFLIFGSDGSLSMEIYFLPEGYILIYENLSWISYSSFLSYSLSGSFSALIKSCFSNLESFFSSKNLYFWYFLSVFWFFSSFLCLALNCFFISSSLSSFYLSTGVLLSFNFYMSRSKSLISFFRVVGRCHLGFTWWYSLSLIFLLPIIKKYRWFF